MVGKFYDWQEIVLQQFWWSYQIVNNNDVIHLDFLKTEENMHN